MSEEDDAAPEPVEITAAPAPDPLIEPTLVARMGRDISSGKLTHEEMSEPYPGSDWEVVPEELRQFIVSQKLDDLMDALRARPTLYWHPIVARQVLHLHRVASDPGYEGENKSLADAAQARLEHLLEVHAERLVRSRRVVWKATPNRPGPRATIPNPHPGDREGSGVVEPSQLQDDWKILHVIFSREGARLKRQSNETKDGDYRKRLATCVHSLLAETPIAWSGLWSFDDPSPPSEPSSPFEASLSSALSIRWNTDFGSAVAGAFESYLKDKYGLPATLAYFVLGHLLGVSGEKVFNTLDHYRRHIAKQGKPLQ